MIEIPISTLKKIRDFLHIKTGIYIDDNKLESSYKRKIIKLMEEEKYTDPEKFFHDIAFKKNSRLLQNFIDTSTINETYFFREEHQFRTLINYVLPELDSIRDPSETINILSAPCSTGEEVYSIAIYLMEEGELIKKRDFTLLGIDIDSKAIKKAKEGIYSERSLNKVPEHLRKKYFYKEENVYKVKEFLREAVSFEVVNVLDKYKMKRLGKFDVIFSRNMLIYFTEKDRNEVIYTFYNMLKDNGYLFLGHAERIPSSIKVFKQQKLGESFVYKKVS